MKDNKYTLEDFPMEGKISNPEGPYTIGSFVASSSDKSNQDKIISLLEAIYSELESINSNLR